MNRVLICGSRSWDDLDAVRRRIAELPDTTLVIHGGAWGADRLAGRAARERGLHVAVVEPLWERFGGGAGHRRNEAMLVLQPDLVIAFSHDTAGTRHMIETARTRGIEVEVVSPAPPRAQSAA